MKRHVLELVGAILLCLAAFFGYSMGFRISLPAVGMGSGVTVNTDELAPDPIAFRAPQIRWPKFRTFCAGLCTNEEFLQ